MKEKSIYFFFKKKLKSFKKYNFQKILNITSQDKIKFKFYYFKHKGK
jgi:hypothetical protein